MFVNLALITSFTNLHALQPANLQSYDRDWALMQLTYKENRPIDNIALVADVLFRFPCFALIAHKIFNEHLSRQKFSLSDD